MPSCSGRHGRYLRVLLAAFTLCLFTSVHADDLLARAQRLIDEKKSGEAFELLHAQVERRAGTPDYDLLLGIAALDSGKPTQAVFALERVLVVDPGNARARAELGRAYFEMGENEAARQEFTETRRQILPPSITRAVDEYLTAIEARFATARRRIDVFIEAAAGYDSNVNSAADQSTVAVPAFGNLIFTLDDSGREQDSGFFELGAGMLFSSPFLNRSDLRIFGSADLHERVTVHEQDFRTRIANGLVGLRLTRDRNAFLVSLLGQHFALDGDRNREQGGAQVQWLHAYSDRTQFSLFGQFAAQRFPEQTVRHVNQYSGGAGFVHVMDRAGDPIVYASAFAGSDDELRDSRPDIGRWFAGLRVGGQYTWDEKITLLGNVSYQYSRYGADDPLFLERRRDDFVFVRAGLNYALNKNWSVRPEVQYSMNDSTLPINDFDRWQTFITVRNQF